MPFEQEVALKNTYFMYIYIYTYNTYDIGRDPEKKSLFIVIFIFIWPQDSQRYVLAFEICIYYMGVSENNGTPQNHPL